MEKYTFDSDVRGYYRPQDVWKPAIGKILHAQQELDNAVDKFAVRVVKNNETVGHLLCKYLRILWYLIARGGKKCLEVTGRIRHCKQLCGGMEIPCRMVFSCSTKVKIDRLRREKANRLADKHSMTQMAPLRATTHEKVSEQQYHALSFIS